MTWELLMPGLTQTAAEQRSAIEQVVAEQVADPDAIEEALMEAPRSHWNRRRRPICPHDRRDRRALGACKGTSRYRL